MDAATITTAGLETLDDVGFDKLSMRGVAARLGVQVGGLYYYVPDKAALLRRMADVICARASAELAASGDWRADAHNLCDVLCREILNWRDGARLLAESPLVGSREALRLMERLMRILQGGLPPALAAAAADTLMGYLTGYVLQEQLAGALAEPDPVTVAQLAADFPAVAASLARASAGADFAAAVDAIMTGYATLARLP